MPTDLTRFSLEAIGVWIISYFVIALPMREVYLNWPNSPFLYRWYGFKEFSPYSVISGDLFYMLVGLIIAYRIHAYIVSKFPSYFTNYMVKFVALFLVFWAVQVVGDLTFYAVITSIKDADKNKWLKFFKDYGRESGLVAIMGDSLYIFIWTLAACLVRFLPHDILVMLFFFYMFIYSIFAEAT